ncbi:hypothetical protein [Paraburkholderia franconis]|nr:hypothetical protein [Paraburkholderia franconis]
MEMSTAGSRFVCTAALAATFALIEADAAARECPDFVELPSGSSFNVARLIYDSGSPDAALRKVRQMFARASESGCPRSEKPAACDETLAVARKAITALELCTADTSADDPMHKRGSISPR